MLLSVLLIYIRQPMFSYPPPLPICLLSGTADSTDDPLLLSLHFPVPIDHFHLQRKLPGNSVGLNLGRRQVWSVSADQPPLIHSQTRGCFFISIIQRPQARKRWAFTRNKAGMCPMLHLQLQEGRVDKKA